MLSHNPFNTILIFPILNILVAFYKILLTVHIPGAFGFAIVALVVLIRLLLHPFFKQQIDTATKMQSLKPHLDKLSITHKGNPKALQAEQMRLYKDAGINPATGCLFMVIQIPVFIGLYNTLNVFLTNGTGIKAIAEINKALYWPFLHISSIDPNFLGFNLALSPQKAHLWYYYLIPVVTGLLQYLQARAQTPTMAPVKNIDKKDPTKKDNSADFQSAMNTQMKYILPVVFGYFSYSLPAGLALYWNIFSLFSIIQYRTVHKKVDPVIASVDSVQEAKTLEQEIELPKETIKALSSTNTKKAKSTQNRKK